MSDDAYALGVCLLDFGLWRTFFAWNKDQKAYLINEVEWVNVHLIRSTFIDENGDTQYNKIIWYDRRDELIRAAHYPSSWATNIRTSSLIALVSRKTCLLEGKVVGAIILVAYDSSTTFSLYYADWTFLGN